jgi:tRNA modification GTPase
LAWGPDETAGLEGRDQAAVSARSGQDIPKLERRMYDRVTDGRPGPEKSAVVPNLRHHTLLKEAAGSAARVREGFEAGWTADILAFEVRSGLDALGRITGETVTGDLLDRIFSSFCLGK